ncbi:MAG: GGDEF domain-containing protein, partial [Pyrinomonadaceae bacterium]
MEYEGARIKVERLAQRFGEPYKLLAYHAALPLMLTPELLNYLRNKFLGDKVPWVAEVDLLLSDLCKEVAYEQFAMEPDTRAYLLAEADKNLGRPHMQDVARLLIRYVQSLSGSASAAARHQLQAQRWAAMVYLDEQRESAVQEIAESFLRSMTPVASAAGHLGSLPIDESELARLSQITKILAPQLEASRELVEYAAEVSRILAARGADAQAAAAGSKPARVADVALPAPAVLLGETIPEEEEDEELEDYTEDDLFIGFSSEDQSFLNGYLLPRLVAAGLGCQLFQYRPGGKDVLDDLVSRVRRGGRALLLLNSHSVSEIRGLQGLLDDAPDYHELEDKFLLGFTQQMKLPHQLRKLRIYRFYGAPGQIEDELKLLLDTRFYDAFHDHLTRLPNRALFMDHLKLAIARARRNPGTKFAVLSLGLDRFKVINNAFGHTIGDQLLVRVADRLESCLRPGDTVARIGGDDFAMLLEDIETPEAEVEMAERVQKALTQPFQIGRHEVLVTVSIGVAPSSTGYERAEDILRDADTAMYRAKSLGKARYEIFDKAMHARAINLLQMETDMRRALEREEFVLHYQP